MVDQPAQVKGQSVTQPKGEQKSVAREYAEALLMALLLAIFIRSFVVQAFKIPSGSMLPTLLIGDHILVNKFLYGLRLPYPIDEMIVQWGQPEREDIVVFVFPRDPSKDFIKRVVAVEGDTVEIRHKQVYLNGVNIEDPHATFADGSRELDGPRDNFGPVTVPPGKLFVMGDNRDRSHDSRFWGFVDLEDVKGKAFMIYWSWDGEDRWVRWERIGDLIH
ncbi:MAG: signal peptidase I [Candidatus Binatia bacterium]